MLARSCCQPLASLLEPDAFRALGEPGRAALLLQLAGAAGPQAVTQLAAALPVGVSVVSRHLKVLRDLQSLTVRFTR